MSDKTPKPLWAIILTGVGVLNAGRLWLANSDPGVLAGAVGLILVLFVLGGWIDRWGKNKD